MNPQQPQANKFVGRKIENSILFTATPSQGGAEGSCKIQQAIPLSFAVPGKKIGGLNLGSGSNSQINEKIPIQKAKGKPLEKELSKKRDENSLEKQQNPQSLQERRQQKKNESFLNEKILKKDISLISHNESSNQINLSSDEEDFAEIMVPKKYQAQQKGIFQIQSIVQQQQQQQQYQQQEKQPTKEEIIQEEKRQADIDDMIRKSNLKFKNEKKIQEMETFQKLTEASKLKEKLKKQEEEIRKRNQLKTQQFKEKKKKEKQVQQKMQQDKQEQMQLQQQQRRKSLPKNTKSIMSNESKLTNQSEYRTYENRSIQESNDTETFEKNESTFSKEQFDQATKNRVKELMRKQKEEKEREFEEKERKRIKLEMLRQDQLHQLSKAKIKTKEQEEEEKRTVAMNNKRTGGGGGGIAQSYARNEETENINNNIIVSRVIEQKPKSRQSQPILQTKKSSHLMIKNTNSTTKIAAKTKPQVSESFLKEHIQKSIKKLYPECSLEELVKLEEEYKKDFMVELEKDSKVNSLKRKNSLNRIKQQKQQQESSKQLKRQVGLDKEELIKLMNIQKVGSIDFDSIQNPEEMIFNLKAMAQELEIDLESNDKKYGVGKYKRSQSGPQKQKTQIVPENQDKIKEEYLKELYEDAQNNFTPEEFIEFDKFVKQKLSEGTIPFFDERNQDQDEGDIGESQSQDEEEEEENQQKHKQGKKLSPNRATSKKKQQSINKTQSSSKLKSEQMSNHKSKEASASKRINHHHLDLQNSAPRGRSSRPKSCLAKEAKEKRSKTVTFDGVYVSEKKNDEDSLSPSVSHQKLMREKYSFGTESDDFTDKAKENNRKIDPKNSDYDERFNDLFLKKVQGIADKRLSMEISENNLGRIQGSIASSNLRGSQLKNNKSHPNNENIKQVKEQTKPNQQKKQKPPQNHQITPSSQKTLKQQQSISTSARSTPKQDQQLPQSRPKLENPKENIDIDFDYQYDIFDYNENFDFDKFKISLQNQNLKELAQVKDLDLSHFFTNEKINTNNRNNINNNNKDDSDIINSKSNSNLTFIPPAQYQQFSHNNNYNNDEYDDDEEDERLFVSEGKEKAMNYYTQNGEHLKSANKNPYEEELESLKMFEDEKMFGLSATEMLKLANHNNQL